MLRAVPAMIRQAWSMSRALRSLNLVSAIFLTCSAVTVPTLVLCGSAEPEAIPAACFEQHGGGGALGDELERPVGVDRDLDRDRRPLHLLGPFVELHHELTDVDPVLAQRRADRGRRGRLAAGALELHLRRHHLGHRPLSLVASVGAQRRVAGMPVADSSRALGTRPDRIRSVPPASIRGRPASAG